MCAHQQRSENNESIEIDGYDLKLNSVGRGKGIVTYFKQNMFQHYGDVKKQYFQLTKITSDSLEVISVYRSKEGEINNAVIFFHALPKSKPLFTGRAISILALRRYPIQGLG